MAPNSGSAQVALSGGIIHKRHYQRISTSTLCVYDAYSTLLPLHTVSVRAPTSAQTRRSRDGPKEKMRKRGQPPHTGCKAGTFFDGRRARPHKCFFGQDNKEPIRPRHTTPSPTDVILGYAPSRHTLSECKVDFALFEEKSLALEY